MLLHVARKNARLPRKRLPATTWASELAQVVERCFSNVDVDMNNAFNAGISSPVFRMACRMQRTVKTKRHRFRLTCITTQNGDMAHESNTDDVLVQSLDALAKAKEQGADLSAKSASIETQRARYSKIRLIMLGIGLIAVFLFIGVQAFFIAIGFKSLIKTIKVYAPPEWHPSGFATALSVRFPALASWVGFSTPALPIAAMLCVGDETQPNEVSEAFKKNPTLYLAQMWNYAQYGVNAKIATNQTAIAIICKSWAQKADVKLCFPGCIELNALYVAGIVSNSITAGFGIGALAKAAVPKMPTAGVGGLWLLTTAASAAFQILSYNHFKKQYNKGNPRCS